MKSLNVNGKFKPALIAVSIVAVAAVATSVVLCTMLMSKNNSANNGSFANEISDVSTNTGLVMDENAQVGGLVQRSQEEIQEELNRKVEEGMINISMNTSPVFENGKAKGNLMIVNNEVNNYPQIVYIVRKDTGEEIYRSGGIAVGSKIEYAPLAVELPAGTYECIAYFNNADPETGAILGTAGAEIVITVKN